MRHLTGLVPLLLAAVTASTASTASGQSAGAPRTASGPATVPMEQLSAVADRVVALRANPETITLRVGQSLHLDSIRVTAMDATGQLIGRLPAFDFGIKPGEPATAVPRVVTGLRPGTTEMRVSFPSGPWGKRTKQRPFTMVKVVVKP